MKNFTFALKEQLRTLDVEMSDRTDVIVYIAARTIGMNFALPTSAVENPYAYFRDNHTMNLHRVLSELNEELVVDVDSIETLVTKLWVMRYSVVHEPFAPRTRDLLSVLIAAGNPNIPAVYTTLVSKYDGLRMDPNMEDLLKLED